MSEQKHTPGPWSVQSNSSGGFEITAKLADRDLLMGVLCQRSDWPHRAEMSLANARLIASAPDLLEALKAICRDNECWYSDRENCRTAFRAHPCRHCVAEAAIAKAEAGA